MAFGAAGLAGLIALVLLCVALGGATAMCSTGYRGRVWRDGHLADAAQLVADVYVPSSTYHVETQLGEAMLSPPNIERTGSRRRSRRPDRTDGCTH